MNKLTAFSAVALAMVMFSSLVYSGSDKVGERIGSEEKLTAAAHCCCRIS